MNSYELDRMRIRDADRDGDASQDPQHETTGNMKLLGQIGTNGTFPTVAQSCFVMTIVEVFGNEIEATVATAATVGGSFYAYNVSSLLPVIGDQHICTKINNRWVFRNA
jgi:hypothetical protein